ncbi:uncharacterized protein LOC111866045 isoform X2 [Cryptotermes secundus]|uniref:uncharacterized protein LOC111866045 isoform X2 n=1 Tax=Cryptotermes secundus TaxID=105785 RepID=UPI000CD7BFFF|nr:uncharacterized protein LOC111866045 isoform X2 [Cryptotermes secundus]
MLKWLLAGAPSPQTASVISTDIVTDDPLATICAHKVDRPLEIYAVSRVNPLFYEDDDRSGCDDRKNHQEQQQQDSPELPEKSASSGYGSHRYNSSSESGTEEPTEPAILRDDAITILEQNLGYVKSILVAVKGNNPSPKRYNQRPIGVMLTPIPEGKVDYCIPRPVWPRHQEGPPDSIVDDALLLYTSFTYTSSDQNSGKSTENTDPRIVSSEELVRGLSNTISQVTEFKENGTPKDNCKKTLKLESLQRSPSSEEILRKLSVSLSHRESLTKMSRALSNSSGSSGGALRTRPSEDRETARLLLLQRLEESTRASRAVVRGSSSSSTSSSGFSSSYSSQQGELSSVTNSVRNAMVYGTLRKLSGDYEKLRKNEFQEQDRSLRFKSAYYPDFTLDMHRAECLMLKIKVAKRRRCWCRLVTSLLGLVFFLMSVMVVSMLVTKGKRLFGPI